MTSPRLIAIGGMSGTGKSSLAAALLKVVPNAIHLDSDRTRKEIFGVPATTRLPAEAYSLETTQRVVDEMARKVKAGISAGKNIIVSAAFLPLQSRIEEENLARDIGARFIGLWLQADMNTLCDRVALRVNDASDAKEDIVRMQEAEEKGAVTWNVINAALSREEVVGIAAKMID